MLALNVKTVYSNLLSSITVDKLVDRLKELGYTACVVADYNLAGSFEIIETLSSNGIKPIIGLDIDNVIYIAKNKDGYFDLVKAYSEMSSGKKFSPKKENIITVGEGQDYGPDDVKWMNAHYTLKENERSYKVLAASNRKCKVKDVNDVGGQHILSIEELSPTEKQLEGLNKIEESVEIYSLAHSPRLPKFTDGDEYELLVQMCRDGWKKRKTNLWNRDIYGDRVRKELNVIKRANLSSYFLIVQDYVNYMKNKGRLVGAGRGCFLPGTRVLMEDDYYEIEKVRVGDLVYDAYGSLKKVEATYKYDVDEHICRILLDNGRVIKCTSDHLFLTNTGWVPAEELGNKEVVQNPISPRKSIVSISHDHYKGPVYDLQVESRTYNVEGLAVHNSAGGSLVAYLLGITEIDPVKHGLIFERFFNAGRSYSTHISFDEYRYLEEFNA